MPFKLFLLCSFILLARPQDALPFLQPLHPALIVTVTMAALVLGSPRQLLATALSTTETKRYLLFFLIMLVGVPFAQHRRLAFDGVVLVYVVNVCFFVLLVSEITSLQRLKTLVWVICLSTGVYSIFGGLLQMASFGGGRFNISGGVFDPNDTAYVLLSLFPLCLFFVRFNEGVLKRLVALAVVLGAVVTILLTGSRGGILAFAGVLLVLFLTPMGAVRKGHKALLVLVLAFGGYLMNDKIELERYMTLSDISSDYNASAQGGRMELWKDAIDLAFANPITGVGVQCYAFANDRARRLAGDTYRSWHEVHNSYLQIGAEVGLIGFVVFILIYLRSLRTFYRLARSQPQSSESPELGGLAGFMLLGFTGLMISGFFLSQGYSIFSTLYFALAASLERLQSQPSPAIEASHPALDDPEKYSGGMPAG